MRTQLMGEAKDSTRSLGSAPRNISRAIWSGLDALASPIASLAFTAGLVRVLGTPDYGVLVVVLAVSNLSLAINAAISASTTKFLAEAIAIKDADQDALARILTSSLIIVLALDIVLLGATVLFGDGLSRLLFSEETLSAHSNVAAVLMWAVLVVAVQQVDGLFAGALKGLERFKQQALFELCSRAGITAGAIYVGWLTADLHRVMLAQVALVLVSTFCRCLLLRRSMPAIRLFARPGGTQFKRLLRFGSWMWLNAAANTAYGTVDRIFIGRLLGPAAAAEFQIYVQLSQLIHFAPSSLFAFSFPVFSRLNAGAESGRPAIKSMYRKVLAMIFVSAGAVATVILIFQDQALAMIAGSAIASRDRVPFVLLICGFAVLSLNIAPYYLLLGLGRSKAVALVTTTSVVLAIVSAVFLIPRLGLEGAAIARFAYAFGSLALLGGARRVLNSG